LLERSYAKLAGLGWIGRNTCLINQRQGSWFFLGELLVSLAIAPDAPPPERCGACMRCVEACPTAALAPGQGLDATKCISYFTIELRGAIPQEQRAGIGAHVFGCDICQDVCPWNRKSPLNADPELEARRELVNPALDWLAQLDEAEFERHFNGSPVRRAGFLGLRRNAAIAMGNSGQERFAPWLEKWPAAADEGLRTAARWALKKLHAAGNPPQAS
jgi:epoxyqueuosine reductase